MASIVAYETESGRRYQVRYRHTDGRSAKRGGFRTKKLAELYAATVEVDKATGSYIDPARSRVTIGGLGPDWLEGKKQLKPSSYRALEIAWRVHVEPQWGGIALNSIEHSDVQRWINRLTKGHGERGALGATSVIRAHGVLAGIIDTAVKDRRLAANPARDIQLPRKVPKDRRYLTHQEVARLAAESGQHESLVLLLAYTGLRWGEAIGLRVKDVNLERRRLTVTVNAVEIDGTIEVGTPKTHSKRSVPFPAFLDEAMKYACANKLPDALVFSDQYGFHLRRTGTSSASQGWFAYARSRAGLGHLTLHDLRHTAASLAIAAGANVKAVQNMLGHASAAMTLDVYADLFPDDLEAVANALNDARERAVG